MKKIYLPFVLLILAPYSLLANAIYFPQVAMGGGYSTTITLLNIGTSPISSQVKFFNQNGGALASSVPANIPVGGSIRVTLPDSGSVAAGWAVIDAGVGLVQGVASFDYRINDNLQTTAGVLGIAGGNQFILPVDMNSKADTGAAIANVGSSIPVVVRLRLLSEDGTIVATSNDTHLNPLGPQMQIASFISQLFPQLSGTSFKGSLAVEAAAGTPANSIVATALVLKEGMLSAIPVIPSGMPIFQSNSIRATITQFNVYNDNSKASLTYTIENTTDTTLYLANINDSYFLEDDLNTNWDLGVTLAGIATVYSNSLLSKLAIIK
jgi:hypothetical protein